MIEVSFKTLIETFSNDLPPVVCAETSAKSAAAPTKRTVRMLAPVLVVRVMFGDEGIVF